jgi:glutamate--cysteine ligase
MDDSFDTVGALAPQIRSVSDYIARGINHGCGDCIGLELEHFIVRADNLALVSYFDDPTTGAVGVGGILARLAPFYDENIYETSGDGQQHLIGLSRRYANITLEPGAQFEISIGPVLTIADLDIVYQAFRAELDPLLAEFGYRLLELGYHPTSSARDIPLIPKDRYHFMDEHFKSTGQHGICMMRATASTQVSVDYTSEADAVRKFRIANALGPLLAFVTDNTPLFEGRLIGSGGTAASGLRVPQRMARTVIWDDVDASRSMVAPHTFDDNFGFDSYAASILQAPAIFTLEINEDGTKQGVPQGMKPFAEALASQGQMLNRATIEHLLSLFFFDVRFKTYIEIRMADSLPIEYALAYTALIKGLFYHEDTVRYLEEQFKHLDASDIASAKIALRNAGYDAVVYQCPVTRWLEDLIAMAQKALDAREQLYLEPLTRLVAARATLADKTVASIRYANAAAQEADFSVMTPTGAGHADVEPAGAGAGATDEAFSLVTEVIDALALVGDGVVSAIADAF